MTAEIRTVSLSHKYAQVLDTIAKREGGRSAAVRYLIQWFLDTNPLEYLNEIGITVIPQTRNVVRAAGAVDSETNLPPADTGATPVTEQG